MKPTEQGPPESLGRAGAAFWGDVTSRFVFEEPHHLKVLEQAATCLDRIEQAQAVVEREGVFILDRFEQVKEHPGLKTERDFKVLFLRALRELGLDLVQTDEYTRPRRQY